MAKLFHYGKSQYPPWLCRRIQHRVFKDLIKQQQAAVFVGGHYRNSQEAVSEMIAWRA
jgi:tRNA U34 2-thiouridine synthase MnmA/TrmU